MRSALWMLRWIGVKALCQLDDVKRGNVPSPGRTSTLRETVGFTPATPIVEGVSRFVAAFRDLYAL